MVLEQSDIHMAKNMNFNLNLNLTPYKNINSKWIIATNLKHRTINLPGRKTQKICDLWFGNKFLDMAPKEKKEEEMVKLSFFKIKNFLFCKRRC